MDLSVRIICNVSPSNSTNIRNQHQFSVCRIIPNVHRDLLQVPQYQIVQCLNQLPSGSLSRCVVVYMLRHTTVYDFSILLNLYQLFRSTDRCKEILDLCNGIDRSTIEDDGGTLQKSLSVENSLRQGTIRTKDQPSPTSAIERSTRLFGSSGIGVPDRDSCHCPYLVFNRKGTESSSTTASIHHSKSTIQICGRSSHVS